mmetsp:Transcript_6955/g.11767  ORF Transcript_6955/g.11767 Transcript_6955/m.11767 type:complete len:314 (-) Transcript_6955:598-1539(-)|eukprot:CAMPEP_0185012282 /NCGR_PEP_ID=MMETSP1098-20130426/98221_1 /TAXON_ID=89044 /ORGANISM="Spumella elongata, Strain CCAP 955/1" /LENGTH=313 /DNA_ID=CAMNT_0027541337 /DNA_START=106 /DNA_END=1047 /DNA_ORIENTATION=+
MSEDNNLRIREIFSILTQGVEMTQYETDPNTHKSTVGTKIVWMDSDIYRICVDHVRPSMAERAQGKIPPGIYLRDIAEIREGAESFQFTENKVPPRDINNCLSLVGSERTISLELPSKFTRDWFLTRFRLLAEDILVDQERQSRRFKVWEKARQLSPVETQEVAQLQSLLERGVQVLHHELSGKVVESVLRYARVSNDLQLVSKHEGFFFTKETLLSINVSDISELRPGSHSLAFVRTGSTANDTETLSIISSENVFNLQFINQSARDLFTERLFLFVLFFLVNKNPHGNEEGDDEQFDTSAVDASGVALDVI